METGCDRLCARNRASDYRRAGFVWYFRAPRSGRDGSVDRAGKGGCDRRAHQPLCDFARLSPQRGYRFELFPLHCSVRVDQTRHFDAGARRTHNARPRGEPGTSDCRARAGLRARFRKKYGDHSMIDVVMPQMGESIVEGTLTKWLKKQGEQVERDEPLFEISTDKVDTEIPAPVAGT